MTLRERRKEEEARVAAQLLEEDSTVHFLARDLGFPTYTAIHDAVKPIIAKAMAEEIVRFSGWFD